MDRNHVNSLSIFTLIIVSMLICGCNGSALRIPGASLSFPDTSTGYAAKSAMYPHMLVVLPPTDQRPNHYGEDIAGTGWTACATDPFWTSRVSQVVQERLVDEFRRSGLFSQATMAPTAPDDVVMKTQVEAFCAKTVGFLFRRVAGMVSLRVTLEQNGKVLLERRFQRVVTDGDKEYTGWPIATVEEAMKVSMADSLRELMKDMLKEVEAESAKWKAPEEGLGGGPAQAGRT